MKTFLLFYNVGDKIFKTKLQKFVHKNYGLKKSLSIPGKDSFQKNLVLYLNFLSKQFEYSTPF